MTNVLSLIRGAVANQVGIIGGTTTYDVIGDLPLSGNEAGDQAFVIATNRLYLWSGTGWYNIAIINATPTFSTGPDASYTLASDGVTTTVISLLATDPEGFTINYSAIADSDFNGLATVLQDSSVFTITPKSEANATTSTGTLTFKATDGVNIASEISTFTLSFGPAFELLSTSASLNPYGGYERVSFAHDGSRAHLYKATDFSTYSGIISVADRGDSDMSWSYTTRLYGNNDPNDVINNYSNGLQWYSPFSSTDFTQENLWSGDGTRLVVPNGYYYGSSGRGRITVWKDTAGTWSIEQDIEETNGWRWGAGGASIDSDGLFLIVGGQAEGSGVGNDRIKIYSRSGSTWSTFQTLNAANTYVTNTGQYWSQALISRDSLKLVGVYSTSQTRSPAPQLSIFTRANTASSFTNVYNFTTDSTYNDSPYNGSNLNTTKFGSGYGHSVSFSGDGNTIAVCEREADTPVGQRYGRVHIFRNVSGSWTRVANLYLSSENMAVSSPSAWPIAVTLNHNGNKVAAFDWLCDTEGFTNNGRAYIFTNGATDTDWTLTKTIEGPVNGNTIGLTGARYYNNDDLYVAGKSNGNVFLMKFRT